MVDLVYFYFQMILLEVKMTLLSSLRRRIVIFYWWKSLLILYLTLLIGLLARSFSIFDGQWNWDVNDGEAGFFFTLQIKQIKNDILISQIKYAKEMVKKFDLDDCNTSKTPMTTIINLSVDEGERPTNIHQYKVMIESWSYS
jgi:hypothetical protein